MKTRALVSAGHRSIFSMGNFKHTQKQREQRPEGDSGQRASLHSLLNHPEQTPDSASLIQNCNSHAHPGASLTELPLATAANASGLQSKLSKEALRLSEDK